MMKKTQSRQRKNLKKSSIAQLAFGLLLIVLLNIIGIRVFTRFDLTSEKRYSLSETTKDLLRDLDDIVYFKIYLEGDFPADFKRLRNSTREMLDEFRAYSDNIQYEFINPSSLPSEAERNDFYRQLMEKGLNPTDLHVRREGGATQQIVFPGAIVTFQSKELAMPLLLSQMGVPSELVLNNSIESLEYNISNVIRKLSSSIKPKVAFIEGHGELNGPKTYDIGTALLEYYDVERVRIDGQLSSLTRRDSIGPDQTMITNKYKALIVAKPDSAFSDKDKFILDQYIMRGGKVLWLVEPVFASMDSLQMTNKTIGIGQNLRLDDMFFKYGVRLNPDLIMDLNAMPIPLRTGQIGNQPQIEFYPWYFFPLLMPLSDHPIVKNLNTIRTEFVSSIDTVGAPSIRKTVLLHTSPYSRVLQAPVLIDLDILKQEPEKRLYRKPPQPVAVLLEGRFESVYKNRLTPEITDNPEIGFRAEGKENKMIVIADGDMIKNQLDASRGYPLPLGYDQFTRQTFGNKEFILNAINYLCDDSGLLTVRSREVKLRLLDKTKLKGSRSWYQLINVVLPVFIVLLFGLVMTRIRKRKYTRK